MEQQERSKKPGVSLDIDRCGCCGSLQLSINFTDEKGSGHGYRIMGDSYNGRSSNVRRRVLDARDIREMRSYLDLAEQALPAAQPQEGQ
jgi:hypothetical protein